MSARTPVSAVAPRPPRRGIVHLELANPRPLAEPIPGKGQLGLWTPPAEVLEQLQAVTR